MILAGILTGCVGYKVGPVSGVVAGDKSVQVVPFLNQTLQPRLTEAVTQQLRKELQRDGTFTLATRDSGDIVVNGTLTRYDRRELSFSSDDVLTVRDYRLTIVAQVIVRERSNGEVLFDGPVNGVTLIRVGSDLASAERQALPLLARDLARNITDLLTDGTW